MRNAQTTVALLVLLGTPHYSDASSIDKAMVLRVIKQRQAEYQRCYTEALGRNPQLAGRLLIRFTVESDGHVSAATEPAGSPRFADAAMARCMTDEFLRLRFPTIPKPIHINYPMNFILPEP